MKAIDKIIPETRATDLRAFWTLTPEHIYAALHCGNSGLNSPPVAAIVHNPILP